MNEEEMRYRVSAVVTSTLQIVVQTANIEESKASANAIDFDKWSVVSSKYVTVDIAKDFFERKLVFRSNEIVRWMQYGSL
jgi:hypothetical protein